MHKHKELGINISLGLLLQRWVLNFPPQNHCQKTEPSAQLGMRTPWGEAMSVHKKALAQGLLTITQGKEGMP